MEIISNVFIFAIGLVCLVYGANFLIQSSVKLAYIFKLTPIFIGVVLIAFGTSVPELMVGIIAAVKNQKAIALGNIVGSNIANIGLVLGLCAVLTPLKLKKGILRGQLLIMLFSAGLLYFLSRD